MSEHKHLKVEKAQGVARITFDRPKHNVLNIEMMNELNAELESLIADNDSLQTMISNVSFFSVKDRAGARAWKFRITSLKWWMR